MREDFSVKWKMQGGPVQHLGLLLDGQHGNRLLPRQLQYRNSSMSTARREEGCPHGGRGGGVMELSLLAAQASSSLGLVQLPRLLLDGQLVVLRVAGSRRLTAEVLGPLPLGRLGG